MTDCLFVVIGAGASFASTSLENVGPSTIGANQGLLRATSMKDLRPPLVTELFDPRFAGILDKYPIAQWAAADIRRQTNTPVAIEEFLRTHYRDSDDERDQRKFHAVHWYLQDLLWTVSKHYTTNPDNYYRLMTGCLRLPRVVFITLNYDTLLDDRLRLDAPIDSMEAYVDPNRNWSLIKLHGSVDWGLPIDGPEPGPNLITSPPAEISVERENIHLRRPGSGSIDDVRLERMGSRYFYPAMSVPVGTRDELSCPVSHVHYLRAVMQARDQLDVLMLGYSALDEEVLTLFKSSSKTLRSLYVVNADANTAGQTHQRVTSVLGRPVGGVSDIYQRSFAEFVGTEDFDRYLEDI